MSNINNVVVAGNLTRDPELRATSSGMPVLQFSIACNISRKEGDGWKDYPNYIDCVMFGKRAQSLAPYLERGYKVTVSGSLRWSQWETKSGEKRSKLEVMVNEVELPPRGWQAPQAAPQAAPRPSAAPMKAPQFAEVYDQDIPF